MKEKNQNPENFLTLPMLEYEYEQNINSDIKSHYKSAALAREYILQSTAKYHNRVVRTLYVPKIFTQKEINIFEELIKELYSIFHKIMKEYEINQQYRELFGFPKELEDLILRERTYSTDIPVARIDIFYHEDTNQFQFCEFNTDGTSAMNEDRELNIALRKTKAYQMFAKKHRVESMELFDSWIDEFLLIYEEYADKKKCPKKPNVVIVDFMEHATENEFLIFKECFEKRGICAEICDIRELQWDGMNCRTKMGMRIDAIYRRATTADIMSAYDKVQNFRKAVVAEAVCLIGDFRTQIVHNKILYKIMHLPETLALLTEREKDYIYAHVPYTLSLTTESLKENPDIEKELYQKKDQWIIKPEDSYGSLGVHAGVECTPYEWEEHIQKCKNRHYILQRFCKPYQLKNIDLGTKEQEGTEPEWKMVSNLTGLFVYNGKLKGIYSRISYDSMISTQYNEMSLPTIIVKE